MVFRIWISRCLPSVDIVSLHFHSWYIDLKLYSQRYTLWESTKIWNILKDLTIWQHCRTLLLSDAEVLRSETFFKNYTLVLCLSPKFENYRLGDSSEDSSIFHDFSLTLKFKLSILLNHRIFFFGILIWYEDVCFFTSDFFFFHFFEQNGPLCLLRLLLKIRQKIFAT